MSFILSFLAFLYSRVQSVLLAVKAAIPSVLKALSPFAAPAQAQDTAQNKAAQLKTKKDWENYYAQEQAKTAPPAAKAQEKGFRQVLEQAAALAQAEQAAAAERRLCNLNYYRDKIGLTGLSPAEVANIYGYYELAPENRPKPIGQYEDKDEDGFLVMRPLSFQAYQAVLSVLLDLTCSLEFSLRTLDSNHFGDGSGEIQSAYLAINKAADISAFLYSAKYEFETDPAYQPHPEKEPARE
jgi:hypothetical protein